MPEYKYPGYGPTDDNWLTPRAKTKGGYHGGTDNRAKAGTPVYAQYSGEIFRTGNIDGYGMSVVVKSKAPDGTVFYQLYGHLGPDPLPPPGTPVVADQPIPGAVIGTKEYVKGLGGLTTGPHLHREIISGRAPLNKDPKQTFGIWSSDIKHKADPDRFDVNHPVFPYQNGEPQPPLQPRATESSLRPPQVRPPPSGGAPSMRGARIDSAPGLPSGIVVPDAEGPTSLGGPNGPVPLQRPVRSPAPADSAPAADPRLPPLHFAPEVTPSFGPFAVPGLFRSDAFGDPGGASAASGMDAPSLPTPPLDAPRRSPETTLLAVQRPGPIGDGNGIGDWRDSVAPAALPEAASDPVRRLSTVRPGTDPLDPSSSASSPRPAASGGNAGDQSILTSFPTVLFPLEALFASDANRALDQWASASPRRDASRPVRDIAAVPAGPSVTAIDPSSPDRVPAGGLLGIIQEYMRNNGY